MLLLSHILLHNDWVVQSHAHMFVVNGEMVYICECLPSNDVCMCIELYFWHFHLIKTCMRWCVNVSLHLYTFVFDVVQTG